MSIGPVQPPAIRSAPAAGGRDAGLAPVERIIEGEILGRRAAEPGIRAGFAHSIVPPGDARRAAAAYLEQARPAVCGSGTRIDCYV